MLDGQQFIARLLRHVLPSGFKRIRHYGLLAPAAKTQHLALTQRLLAMPAANPVAREDAQAFMQRVAALDLQRCCHCKSGRWLVLACLPAQRQVIRPSTEHCRAPP